MAQRQRASAPVMGRDYFACLVDIQDDQLEITDRETNQPKTVEITRFAFVVDSETAGYLDLEAIAWGDEGRAPAWSDRSFAGRIYKAAARQAIPDSFDDSDLLFKPFYVQLKEQLKQGNSYLAIDPQEVKGLPAVLFQGAAAEAIKGQVQELLAAAQTGGKVIADHKADKEARREQGAAERGSSIAGANSNGSQGSRERVEDPELEFEDIPF